eukprot:g1021.t1
MGERKVLSKYIPPDFDPSLVPRGKSRKKLRHEVRMMLPMTVKCIKCGEYMYRGKKYAARVERLENEHYLGIKKVRFYGKCTTCSNPFTIKTDPENDDYEVEEGVTRNFESWKQLAREKKEAEEVQAAKEEGDAMAKLENRTIQSKREMDALDDLDALRALNSHAERVDVDALLEKRRKQSEGKSRVQVSAEEQDEALVKAFSKRRRERRIDDASTNKFSENKKLPTIAGGLRSYRNDVLTSGTRATAGSAPRIRVVRRKRKKDASAGNVGEKKLPKLLHKRIKSGDRNSEIDGEAISTPGHNSGGVGAVGLLGNAYASSSSSSSSDSE